MTILYINLTIFARKLNLMYFIRKSDLFLQENLKILAGKCWQFLCGKLIIFYTICDSQICGDLRWFTNSLQPALRHDTWARQATNRAMTTTWMFAGLYALRTFERIFKFEVIHQTIIIVKLAWRSDRYKKIWMSTKNQDKITSIFAKLTNQSMNKHAKLR